MVIPKNVPEKIRELFVSLKSAQDAHYEQVDIYEDNGKYEEWLVIGVYLLDVQRLAMQVAGDVETLKKTHYLSDDDGKIGI